MYMLLFRWLERNEYNYNVIMYYEDKNRKTRIEKKAEA